MKKRSISIKLIWMGAYFAVILLMCLVFFLGSIMVTQTVKESARKNNEELSVFMQKTLDETWISVFENSMQLVNNSRAEALNKTRQETEFTDLSTYRFVTDFRQFAQSNKYENYRYPWFPQSNPVPGNTYVQTLPSDWTAQTAENL